MNFWPTQYYMTSFIWKSRKGKTTADKWLPWGQGEWEDTESKGA